MIDLQTYYQTDWWKGRSREFRQKQGKCKICGSTEELQTHHLRYRFYREADSDLQCLCKTCHLKDTHKQKDEMDMLDFNHRNPSERISLLIDTALEGNPEKPRIYLGGSRLGVECARALQYEFFHAPKDRPFTGRTLRTFAIGHALEDLAADWIRAGGFDLRTTKADGRQFGFSTANDLIKGHIDGVIVGGPEEHGPYPRLWECKTANSKKWREMEKSKIKKANWTYYIQMQLYMAYMQLDENPALFTAVNKDTSELYFEDVAFDSTAAQDASDRGVRIIEACLAGELLPREYPSADFFQCRWCDWGTRCWE